MHVKSGRHPTKSWVANARSHNAVSSQQLLYNNGERAYLSMRVATHAATILVSKPSMRV